MTKDLTIPKFGVLSYSSIYKRVKVIYLFLADLLTYYCIMHYGGGSLEPRTAIEGSFSAWGGVSENRIAGSAVARLFFLTAIAIAIATRPFKFHENSVSYTSSSFVSSIHSLGCE